MPSAPATRPVSGQRRPGLCHVPAPILPEAPLRCDTRDEYVQVDNTGGSPASLSGWSIFSTVGSQTFRFPSYNLAPGASVYVHSGPGAPETGGNHLRWTTAQICSNDGDTAQLKDPQGRVVDEDGC